MKNSGYRNFAKILTQMNRRGIILMYHRVADLHYDPWSLGVSPDNFEEHMRVIKKYGKPVKMSKMVENLKHFSFGQNEIVITFDDGYSDNLHTAGPILERYAIPATFFIVSGAINNREEFWWDELERITVTANLLPEAFKMDISGKEYRWRISRNREPQNIGYEPGIYPANSELTRYQLYYALWEIIKLLSLKEKKDILKQISAWAGKSSTPRTDYLPMTSQELVSLANSQLFEIGAHTINHSMLQHLSPQEQEEEISRSKNDLENTIKRTVTSFSYPHGDCSPETVSIVRRLGFKNSCTAIPRMIKRNDNPYLLPRYAVRNWVGEEFENNLRHWLAHINLTGQ